jgi:hypothetical protein
MRAASFLPILSFILLASATALPLPRAHADERPKPTPAVQTLLDRAEKEPAADAVKTLEQALTVAEEAKDFAGYGTATYKISLHPSFSRPILERAAATIEKLSPE